MPPTLLIVLFPSDDLTHLNGPVYCHDRLSCYDDYYLFGQLRDLRADGDERPGLPDLAVKLHPLEDNKVVQMYHEEGLLETIIDGMNARLTYAFGAELKKLKQPLFVTKQEVRIIYAAFTALADDAKVYFFWTRLTLAGSQKTQPAETVPS